MTRNISLLFSGIVVVVAILIAGTTLTQADTTAVTFETPTYSVGNIDGQDGWIKTGPYDAEVAANSYGFGPLGGQVLRISNAITSSSFGDMTFSKSLVNEAGETISTNAGMSGGTRQSHFEAEFDFAAASTAQQPGLAISVSPDRGDGSRMSYLRFEDDAAGIDVFFVDVSGTSSPVSFDETQVANDLSRGSVHSAKLVIDYVDGPSNDVVDIYIDDILVHTGTSWENYYRYDAEASAEQTPRTTDNLIFRTAGTAAPATSGSGFLFDNLTLMSGPSSAPEEPVTVTIVKQIDGMHASSTSATSSFPMNATWNSTSTGAGSGSFALSPTGFNNPNPYEATTASMTSGASYSTNEDMTGPNVGADCTTQKPYRLVGYSWGDSRAAAASSTVSTTSPSFTNVTTNKYVYVWNAACVGTSTPPIATSTLKVHILKYLDGQQATASSSNSFLFPMTATWNASSLNGGATTTGSYVLGNNHGGAADQYGADTAAMNAPANYSTSEVTATSNGMVLPIGSTCEAGKYRLLGYKTSAVSFADAATQAISASSPSFWALNSDRYVIVMNEKCGSTTPPPPPVGCAATSTQAFVSNTGDPVVGGGSAVAVATSSAWTASIPGATWIWQASSTAPNQTVGFEQTFTATGTVLSVQLDIAADNTYKVYIDNVLVAQDANLNNFQTGTQDSYNFTATTTPGTHTLRIEVTNFGTFNASGNPAGLLYKLTVVNCPPTTTPPPPTTGCAATTTPAGFTRVDGTPGNNTVTLAPNTFYVGHGGNDKVTGPNGNYIICTGPGNDTIKLGNGTAQIDAGGGNNKITHGNGAATIITGSGNDKITTGNGDKNISTGVGNDKITTGSGNDTIDAGSGNNNVNSGGGNDSVTAGSGNDKVNGQAGTDTCDAGGGNNQVANCEL